MPAALLDDDGSLVLRVVGGADALHDPRTFTASLSRMHVDAMKESLPRHLLLYAALLPICHDAGTRGAWDRNRAEAVVDLTLRGTPEEIDDALRTAPFDRRAAVAYRADLELLNRGHFYRAAQSATGQSDWARVKRLLGP